MIIVCRKTCNVYGEKLVMYMEQAQCDQAIQIKAIKHDLTKNEQSL